MIRTEKLEILWSIVSSISVDVVKLERYTTRAGVTLIPSAYLTCLSAKRDNVFTSPPGNSSAARWIVVT
jgi:hypothetical protein